MGDAEAQIHFPNERTGACNIFEVTEKVVDRAESMSVDAGNFRANSAKLKIRAEKTSKWGTVPLALLAGTVALLVMLGIIVWKNTRGWVILLSGQNVFSI